MHASRSWLGALQALTQPVLPQHCVQPACCGGSPSGRPGSGHKHVLLLQARARLLNKFADLLDEHAAELATLECLVSPLFTSAASSASSGPEQAASGMSTAFLMVTCWTQKQ